jgi:hypothetical protein
MKWSALTALTLLAISGVAFASGASIRVKPSTVHAGDRVVISGSAGGCSVGDRVTLLSKAFSSRHEFASVPAVYARVKSNGRYGHSILIPRDRPAGKYVISGRCGGGNLGVSAQLRVLKP